MESLLLPLWEVPDISSLFVRAMLNSGKRWWSRQARDPPPMREDSCLIPRPLSLLKSWGLAPTGLRDGVFSCAHPETRQYWGLPPTAGEPLLDLSQIYVIWCSGSAKDGRPSSFHQGFSGSSTFPVRHWLLQITLRHSRWFSDGVGRAPAHVHHYIGLWPWSLDNPWQAVYTRLASCW
jgi:hypothetical protein